MSNSEATSHPGHSRQNELVHIQQLGGGLDLTLSNRAAVTPFSCWIRALLAGLILLTVFILTPVSVRAEQKLVLAVHPYLPASELVKRFQPLAGHLAEILGREISVDVSPSYEAHIERIGRDQVDLAYLGPILFVRMTGEYGEKPILGRLMIDGTTSYVGYIAVRRDSPITRLSQLKGKRFAFGDPRSTMSHIVPRHELSKAGVEVSDLNDAQFLGSPRNVALGILIGDFDGGAMKEEVFLQYQKRGLQAIAKTPAIPTHVFVASNRLSAETLHQLREAMVQLNDSNQGRHILTMIREKTTALIPATSSEFYELRGILSLVDGSWAVSGQE